MFPADTAIGALVGYVTTAQRDFAPMNATWGLFPPLPEAERKTDKRERARFHLARARGSFTAYLQAHPLLVADADQVAAALPLVP